MSLNMSTYHSTWSIKLSFNTVHLSVNFHPRLHTKHGYKKVDTQAIILAPFTNIYFMSPERALADLWKGLSVPFINSASSWVHWAGLILICLMPGCEVQTQLCTTTWMPSVHHTQRGHRTASIILMCVHLLKVLHAGLSKYTMALCM